MRVGDCTMTRAELEGESDRQLLGKCPSATNFEAESLSVDWRCVIGLGVSFCLRW
jgi:hypothetical protein